MSVRCILTKAAILLAMCASLIASGGGGGGAPPTNGPPPVVETQAVGITLDPSVLAAGVQEGTLSQQQLTLQNGSAQIRADEITAGLTDVFSVEQNNANAVLAARRTGAAAMPTSGQVTYLGQGRAVVNTGRQAISARLAVQTTASFDTQTVNMRVQSVQGGTIKDENGVRSYTPTGSERFEINGLRQEGAAIGATSTTTATVSGFGQASQRFEGVSHLSASGVFAGATAGEVAVAAGIRATNGQEALLVATGKRQ